MERSRRTASRRRTLGDSASPPSTSETSFDLNSSTSPVATHINITPQSAHNGAGRRATKPLQQRAFTFSPPGSSRSFTPMKRITGTDADALIDEDDNGPKKGGHSLRKRARVDYTFEHIDDEVVVPNSTSSARGRKRKSDVTFDTEDMYSTEAKRRGTSMGADTPSARRRNPSRKSSEMKAYREAVLEDDDNDVQDTIEVGVSYSDLDESEFPEHTWSNPSSPSHSTKSPSKANPVAPPSDINTESRHIIQLRQRSVAEFFAKSLKDPFGETAEQPLEQPAEQLQDEPTKVEPEDKASLQQNTPPPAVNSAEVSTSAPTIILTSAPNEPIVDESVQSSTEKLASSESELANGESSSASKEVVPTRPESPKNIEKESKVTVINGTTESSPHKPNKDNMDVVPVDEPAKVTEVVEEVGKPQQSEQDDFQPLAPEIIIDTLSPSRVTTPNAIESTEQIESLNGDANPGSPSVPLNPVLSSNLSESHLTTDFTNEAKNNEAPEPLSKPQEVKTPPPSTSVDLEQALPSNPQPENSPKKTVSPEPAVEQQKKKKEIPNPAPPGRWAHLTPYVEGEYVVFPEKKGRSDEDTTADEPTPDREGLDMESMVEDNEDNADMAPPEAPTPALNTPTRGSPVPDSTDPTAFNSPAPAGDDADDAEVAESQEPPEKGKIYQYRKLRDAEEYIAAIENYENMNTEDLFNTLEAIHLSLRQWQSEWSGLGKVVDDYENSLRRRAADSKYEVRTRNLHQHGINYEEPDFAVKGYKAREREGMTETRYLQQQDRIMAATYGFEYDPHPSKIGKQNPETQQSGIMTRGRSLRNQPRQTAKATETEEVIGKRQRKPVQLFDPTMQDVSRSSTPVPTRGRRRKNANADGEEIMSNPATSFNTEVASDGEAPKTRRRRGPRAKAEVPSIVGEAFQDRNMDENGEFTKPARRGRGRPAVRYEEADPNDFVDEEAQPELKQPLRRHLLTLKIPKSKNFSEPTSAISDNGESRPSTASSEESSHTAESSYSFRPKRQKRFRDDPDGTEEATQAPPKKRGKRAKAAIAATVATAEAPAAAPTVPTSEPAQPPSNRKVQKIKVVRSEARNGTTNEEGEEPQKDYKSMTKSEKMSASMKNRWANGNMAGAVEKRKATLAAKKAAQAAAEQKLGIIAPKPKGKAAAKKEAALLLQQQQQPQPQQPQQMQQPPPPPQHQVHLQQHPQQQLHPQHPQQHPLHQGGNPGYVHGMPNMGYPPYPPQM